MVARLASLIRPHTVLIGYLALVFLLGGGARDDIASLSLLRPISVGVLAYALVVLDPGQMRANRALLMLAGAWVLLVVLHLIPLPPQLWHNLPGRELAVAIDQAAGLGDQWRPLSLVPFRTMNSLLSLTVPLAALLLAIQCTREELRLTVAALVVMVFASALISLLQVIGGPGNPFYLYRITNGDSAVGLFANRNHNAMALALGIVLLGALNTLHRPLVKQGGDLQQTWTLMLGGAALALVPFLIITQSRAGLVLGLLALIAAVWLARNKTHSGRARSDSTRTGALALNPKLIAGIVAVAALAVAAWFFTGGNALARLAQGGSADDELRLRIWPTTLELAWQHFPLGSGIGSFVEVFEVGEPSSTLGPSYINHAHNDFLELAMTGGVPALAILGVGFLWLLRKGFREVSAAEGRDRRLRQLGVVALGVFALGSLYDYPLRTPSLAVSFILALVWIAGRAPLTSQKTERNQETHRSRTSDQEAATGV